MKVNLILLFSAIIRKVSSKNSSVGIKFCENLKEKKKGQNLRHTLVARSNKLLSQTFCTGHQTPEQVAKHDNCKSHEHSEGKLSSKACCSSQCTWSSQCKEWEHLCQPALNNWPERAREILAMNQHVGSKCSSGKWMALRTARPTHKEALSSTVHADSNWPLHGRHTFDSEEKGCIAYILIFLFLFYVQYQLHYTALFVCTTMPIICSFMYSS